MLLASHIIISGLIGSRTHNYFIAALAGFFSHYILDAIPHWNKYLSPDFERRAAIEDGRLLKDNFFWKEISKVAIDALIGFSVFIFIFLKNFNSGAAIPTFIAIFFGILPDPLQLLYLVTKWRFLKLNYDFQHWLHRIIYKKEPSFWPGIITQILTTGIVFLTLYFF